MKNKSGRRVPYRVKGAAGPNLTCMRLVTQAIMLSATILLRPSSSFLSLQQCGADKGGTDPEGVNHV